MITSSTWQQTDVFDPSNPYQKVITKYTGLPGGYSTFVFNRVPDNSQLLGVDLSSRWTWLGLAAGVAGIGAAIWWTKRG